MMKNLSWSVKLWIRLKRERDVATDGRGWASHNIFKYLIHTELVWKMAKTVSLLIHTGNKSLFGQFTSIFTPLNNTMFMSVSQSIESVKYPFFDQVKSRKGNTKNHTTNVIFISHSLLPVIHHPDPDPFIRTLWIGCSLVVCYPFLWLIVHIINESKSEKKLQYYISCACGTSPIFSLM
jgi:hypothetical protein